MNKRKVQKHWLQSERRRNCQRSMTSVKPKAELQGAFSSSFVLPIRRDGFALLAKSQRVVSGAQQTKFALIGGKPLGSEDSFMCAGRKMNEETGASISSTTRTRIQRGAGVGAIAEYVCPNGNVNSRSMAMTHDLVVKDDTDVDQRFALKTAQSLSAASLKSHTFRKSAIRKGSRQTLKRPTSLQVGLEFVPVNDIKCCKWREEHMFTFPHAVLVSRLMNKTVFNDVGLPEAWKIQA